MIRCRVLTDRIINGRKCRPGDEISLKGPIVDFLVEHLVVERLGDKRKKPCAEHPEDAAPV